MSRLWAYLVRYRLRYAGGIACLLGARALAMVLPWLLGMTVDAIGSSTPVVTRYVALIAAIAVVQAVVRTFSRFVIFNIGRDIEYDLRNDLFRHLEAQPLAFYQQRQTGDLMSRLVNDVTAVRLLLGLGILNFIDAPLAYALGLTAMLLKDVRLTVAALAVYPAAFLVVKRTSRLLMERTFRVQEGLGELSSRVQENLSGIHVVKAYACEAHTVESFARANARFQELNLRLARVRGFIGPVMNIVGGAGVLVVLWYGGREAIAGRLSVGDLVAFIGYLGQLAWPTPAPSCSTAATSVPCRSAGSAARWASSRRTPSCSRARSATTSRGRSRRTGTGASSRRSPWPRSRAIWPSSPTGSRPLSASAA